MMSAFRRSHPVRKDPRPEDLAVSIGTAEAVARRPIKAAECVVCLSHTAVAMRLICVPAWLTHEPCSSSKKLRFRKEPAAPSSPLSGPEASRTAFFVVDANTS